MLVINSGPPRSSLYAGTWVYQWSTISKEAIPVI